MSLDSSDYWYLWNPDKPACKVATQMLKITLSNLLPSSKDVYPEYDRLVADGKVTAVIVFGQIGDGELTNDDKGMVGYRTVAKWLLDAGYAEADAELGRRFTKHIG